MSLHVYPRNDLREHILEGNACPCTPVLKIEENVYIYVHNSYDGREYIEQLTEEDNICAN